MREWMHSFLMPALTSPYFKAVTQTTAREVVANVGTGKMPQSHLDPPARAVTSGQIPPSEMILYPWA